MKIQGVNLQKVWDVDELAAVAPAWIVIFEESAERLPDLRAHLPNTHFCLRLFNDFEEPFKLAERGAELAKRYLQTGDCVVFANEPNYEIPTLTVEKTVFYCQKFIDWWKHFGWPAVLCSPALSPSAPHSDLAPYRDVFMACDYIGLHVYSGAEQHIVPAGNLWPNHRLLITEFGADHGDRAAYCRDFLKLMIIWPNVVGACWFLWDSPEDQWKDWIAKGTPVETALRDFASPDLTEPLRAALTTIYDGTIAAAGLIPVERHEPLRVIQAQIQVIKSEYAITP